MQNRHNTLKEDVAEDGIIPIVSQVQVEILHHFLLQQVSRGMITLEKMVMILISATGRTVRTVFGITTTGRTVQTVFGITTMDNVTNRENTMGPFHKEIGSAEVAIADGGVDSPVLCTPLFHTG